MEDKDNKFKDWQANEAKLLAENNYGSVRNDKVQIQKEGSRQAYEQAIAHLKEAIKKSSKDDLIFRNSVQTLINKYEKLKGE